MLPNFASKIGKISCEMTVSFYPPYQEIKASVLPRLRLRSERETLRLVLPLKDKPRLLVTNLLMVSVWLH